MIVKEVAPSSWKRLHFYTFRVHSLSHSLFKTAKPVHGSVFAILGRDQPIFPNLRWLDPSDELCTPSVLQFFSTTTMVGVILHFSPTLHLKDLESSLVHLVSKCPALKTLELWPSCEDRTQKPALSNLSSLISHLPDLEILRFGRLLCFNSAFVQCTASLSKLRNLGLTLHHMYHLNPNEYSSISNGFPSLKDLVLTGDSAALSGFLNAIKSPIAVVTVYWAEYRITESQATPLFVAIGRLTSLQVFRLRPEMAVPNLPGTSLHPLYQLTRLREVELDCRLTLTEKDTAEMASAWPLVESLRILRWVSTGSHSVPPVQSLSHFVQRCPQLRSLAYPIQPTVPLEPLILPRPFPSGIHPLREFCSRVYDNVPNPAAMAHTLHQIFPRLKEVKHQNWRWNGVQRVLDSMDTDEAVRIL
ncbi:hypothetical protein GYMLUDRAFT_43797 [Collybiopsis luxurians FD-317 M1]|uniref:F-box domain-containing protein n=1 Tax=Collybiopsis luxurians FD-317 M1 TaxID=944289 RepID=A0A0D0CNU9_9AGAR|nr:hypothetical protein GYMLUDRAFT_43797 [Collybiopsis luxurians FD-317 M1]